MKNKLQKNNNIKGFSLLELIIAINKMLEVIKDENYPLILKIKALDYLSSIKGIKNNEKAIKTIRECISLEKDPKLCKKAVEVVYRIKDWESIPYLINLLLSNNKILKNRAYLVLVNITKKKFPKDYDTWQEWYEEIKKK